MICIQLKSCEEESANSEHLVESRRTIPELCDWSLKEKSEKIGPLKERGNVNIK